MVYIKILGAISEIENRIREIENKINSLSEDKSYFSETLSKVIDSSSDKIDQIIEMVSLKYGVDKNLVEIVANVESNKNKDAVSSKGAMGIMQLMPDTARELGVKNPFDIKENIEGGVKYLKELLNKYNGDKEKALAAYNAGPNAVDKYGGIPPYKETQNYVKKIMEEYMKNKGGK